MLIKKYREHVTDADKQEDIKKINYWRKHFRKARIGDAGNSGSGAEDVETLTVVLQRNGVSSKTGNTNRFHHFNEPGGPPLCEDAWHEDNVKTHRERERDLRDEGEVVYFG